MEFDMEAAVLHAPADLRIEKVKMNDSLNDEEALIRVKAVGICGSDIERVMKTGTYHFPTIPGHEFCGVIEKIKTKNGSFQNGERVLVVPIMPCFQCEFCQRGNYGQCEKYDYLGSRSDGGFAEFVKAPVKNLIHLPDEISFQEGSLVEPAAVTLHGIRKVGIQAGDTVAVLGCGAIGLFAIQFAKILGAVKVIAVDIDLEKLKFAKELGADVAIHATYEEPVEQIMKFTNNKGVDVAVETAGVPITQEQCIRIAKKQGRILYLGTSHKDVVIPPKSFECIIRNELNIVGSWNSYSAPFPGVDWFATLEYITSGKLKVKPMISHVFSLAEAPNVIEAMLNKKINYNKVILNIND